MHLSFCFKSILFSDYVTDWCKKNDKCMQNCQIDKAVTAQVSYARKKLRKV